MKRHHKKKRVHLDAGERTWCGIREVRTTLIIDDVTCETCKMVHESGGKTGATLTLAQWALSNGFTTNNTFSGPGVLQTPHVAAGGTITVESTLSVLTTAAPATHVEFTITYIGDDGQKGSASTGADISRVPPH